MSNLKAKEYENFESIKVVREDERLRKIQSERMLEELKSFFMNRTTLD